ncbi:DUF3888 domain-containing protein [Ammoniphilus resinae]|uniref:DUF3888 domain-containing protein n=1 Tax=Ammoniphilus resinae TaxID=861532 RepID=A0ABS4GP01_9BACL|nr:DUF3888 domain-containing protein [Ammoniphilus resinae]MBP1931988.1 hypothetical protein [Ammoniphilus resinae]
MKKTLYAFILSIVFIISLPIETEATIPKPTKDSEQLRLQDMLMIMLTPYIQEVLNNYYNPKTFSPYIELWKVQVLETKRINGFRGFILEITFDIEPTEGGHHVSIGKDRLTY